MQADLLANYKKPARDRIQVSFEYIEFKLGPLRFKKVMTRRHTCCSTVNSMHAGDTGRLAVIRHQHAGTG